MSRSSEIVDDYEIRDKREDEKIYKKDKPDLSIEIKDDNPFKKYDKSCDKMNSIKYNLLTKTSLASMGGIVKSTNDKPIIGTIALDTCYGILFYDRVKKEGICGHAVPSQLTSVLAEMMRWLDGRVGIVEYRLLPGFRNVDRNDYSGLQELRDYMLEHMPEDIKMTSLKDVRGGFRLHLDTLSYEFAFDTEQGVFVTDYVFFDSVEHNPRFYGPKRRF